MQYLNRNYDRPTHGKLLQLIKMNISKLSKGNTHNLSKNETLCASSIIMLIKFHSF